MPMKEYVVLNNVTGHVSMCQLSRGNIAWRLAYWHIVILALFRFSVTPYETHFGFLHHISYLINFLYFSYRFFQLISDIRHCTLLFQHMSLSSYRHLFLAVSPKLIIQCFLLSCLKYRRILQLLWSTCLLNNKRFVGTNLYDSSSWQIHPRPTQGENHKYSELSVSFHFINQFSLFLFHTGISKIYIQ